MRRIIHLLRVSLGLLLLCVAALQIPTYGQESSPQSTGRAVVTKIEPAYPALAKQYHLSGKVKIEVAVLPNGRVKEAKVLGGSPLLASASLVAAKEFKYEAAPKETLETIEFNFH
ncbi:MAG TPA: energy transducer TonB [Candidatus Sulfotelmatobacter sp.]|nr:energy transducer TonB [Candidatus Sulfotelmatobacter sp.]